ncbi:MAG: hypothetical protein J6Y56_07570 [Fibrobacterales bacterium]|nr:hypothetical protein [Fibrobacterales bacterium]
MATALADSAVAQLQGAQTAITTVAPIIIGIAVGLVVVGIVKRLVKKG